MSSRALKSTSRKASFTVSFRVEVPRALRTSSRRSSSISTLVLRVDILE